MKISPLFRWYDLWVGLYIDRKRKRLYLFPVPMLGVCVSWGKAEPREPGRVTLRVGGERSPITMAMTKPRPSGPVCIMGSIYEDVAPNNPPMVSWWNRDHQALMIWDGSRWEANRLADGVEVHEHEPVRRVCWDEGGAICIAPQCRSHCAGGSCFTPGKEGAQPDAERRQR